MSDCNANAVEGVIVCGDSGGRAAFLDTREHLEAFCDGSARRKSARDASLISAGLNTLRTAARDVERPGREPAAGRGADRNAALERRALRPRQPVRADPD